MPDGTPAKTLPVLQTGPGAAKARQIRQNLPQYSSPLPEKSHELTAVNSYRAPRADDRAMSSNGTSLYTSSQLLAATGCTRKALRVYQDKGLIRTRVNYGKRRYGPEAFDRLRLIVGLRELGMPVASIGYILSARDGAGEQAGPIAGQLASEVSAIVQQITSRIDDRVQLRHELVAARETLFACGQCSEPRARCADCAEGGALDAVSRVLLVDEPPSADAS